MTAVGPLPYQMQTAEVYPIFTLLLYVITDIAVITLSIT